MKKAEITAEVGAGIFSLLPRNKLSLGFANWIGFSQWKKNLFLPQLRKVAWSWCWKHTAWHTHAWDAPGLTSQPHPYSLCDTGLVNQLLSVSFTLHNSTMRKKRLYCWGILIIWQHRHWICLSWNLFVSLSIICFSVEIEVILLFWDRGWAGVERQTNSWFVHVL